mgnify:CR=1 FL=1
MRRLGFTSDAGYRFERGVDFEGCARAVERATQLIIESLRRPRRAVDRCGVRGRSAAPRSGARAYRAGRQRLLGITIPRPRNRRCLCAPRSRTLRAKAPGLPVTPPYRGASIARSKRISSRKPRASTASRRLIPAAPGARQSHHVAPTRGRNVRASPSSARLWSTSAGSEIVTFGFVSSAREAALDPTQPITIKGPRSPIAAQLERRCASLLPGLVETLTTNANRKGVGARASSRTGPHVPARRSRLPAAVNSRSDWADSCTYGPACAPEQCVQGVPRRWRGLLHDVKGDLEALAAPRHLVTQRLAHPALASRGRAAQELLANNANAPAGWARLHPRLTREFELPRRAPDGLPNWISTL